MATGHYAVITQNDEGRWLLKKAPCSKDQSYVLYHLTQHQLAHTLMPLAGMEKSEARELAREAGLPVAHKPDSQEICFVQDNDYASFIRRYTGKEPPPGNFIDQAAMCWARIRESPITRLASARAWAFLLESPCLSQKSIRFPIQLL